MARSTLQRGELDSCGGFLVPPELVEELEQLLRGGKKMKFLRVGPKAYINPDQVVRWQFHLTSRSTELNSKDVYEITVTLWLSDGTSTSFSDLETLKKFHSLMGDNSQGGYTSDEGTFSYYLGHLVAFERIKEKV